MAGLILCRSVYAKRPYYINNMAINIYSLEELCYYIYNNIYLIGTDLFDDGLIKFIGRELEEPELAGQLEFLVSENAGLAELVTTVLRSVDYYSEDEILDFCQVIEELDTQNVSSRLKSRADNFLANRRYASAIKNYVAIVLAKPDSRLEPSFYGDAWHNMGVAFANMHLFGDACECFRKAYELNNNPESKQASLAAECLKTDSIKNDTEDEQMYVTFREIETLMDHAYEEAEYAEVGRLTELKAAGDIAAFNGVVDELLAKWKKEYRNYVK